MADKSAFLGGYKVGSISASLFVENGNREKERKRQITSIFDGSDVAQPTFIPVKKKKKMRAENSMSNDNGGRHNPDALAEVHNNETKPIPNAKKMPKNKSCNDDPERLARTVFVGNLPLSMTRKGLKKFFKTYGDIESTRLRSVAVPDLKTSKKVAAIKKTFNPNRNNLNGYVVFKDKNSVEKALESNGTVIEDFHIRVDRVGDCAKQYDHRRSVFVGNLMFDIKEETLSKFFLPCGDILNVRVIRDSITGIGKGFGYVLFKDSSSVSLALKMNNSELRGRKIRIQRSQENPKGSSMSKERKRENFSGMQAKEKFYQKRKTLKQQKKFGLSSSKKLSSKVNKNNNKRTSSFKQKKKARM